MSEGAQNTLRVAAFDSVATTRDVIAALRSEGFATDEISVICSEEAKARHFQTYAEAPSGERGNQALNVAGVAALGLGGATVLTTLLTAGGAAIFAIGAFAGIAAGGTFAALMASRGLEHKAADFYDQAIQDGRLLVIVDVAGQDAARAEAAERIMQEHGSKPTPLAD